MSGPIKVLVVDDSAYNRKTISDILEPVEGVKVVGKATDGDEALRLVSELEPDLITLDLEMPRMDGFTFLRLLMVRRPTPVIVVSGYSAKENVFRALELGAVDFVAKPTRAVTADLAGIGEELRRKVGLVRQLRPSGMGAIVTSSPRAAKQDAPRATPSKSVPDRVLVIGASTGGPTALVRLFQRIPAQTPGAIVVAQHMPERFTRTFAERLDRLGGVRVREASGRHRLLAGEAWVCPGGQCVEIHGDEVVVVPAKPSDRYIPSVDRLFTTAADALGSRVVGAVLTGMGDDGAAGVEAVVKRGGKVFAESPDTAVIYGMPGAAVRTGKVEEALPLNELAERLVTTLRH